MNLKKDKNKWFVKGICALIVGFINGFFGGGGGLITVPVLERMYKLPTKKAHATAIAIMLPISIVSSLVYLFNNEFKLAVTASVTVGVIAGGFIGALLLKNLKGTVVRWIFIVILFSAGIRMIL